MTSPLSHTYCFIEFLNLLLPAIEHKILQIFPAKSSVFQATSPQMMSQRSKGIAIKCMIKALLLIWLLTNDAAYHIRGTIAILIYFGMHAHAISS